VATARPAHLSPPMAASPSRSSCSSALRAQHSGRSTGNSSQRALSQAAARGPTSLLMQMSRRTPSALSACACGRGGVLVERRCEGVRRAEQLSQAKDN
jgi:hypothetical protein